MAAAMETDIHDKLRALEGHLDDLGRVVVAFSGGADSAFLTAVAQRRLGVERVHAVTAVSASLATDEAVECRALAEEWGLRWTPVATDELANAAYRVNDIDRCYHCKTELMDVVGPIAAAEDAVVVLGVNVDDLGDHRPGQRAAAERGAVFRWSKPGWARPRSACSPRSSACGRGTSRRLRAWRPDCRTARR